MGRFSIFSTAELRARGETISSIRAKIAIGDRFRIVKGWYGNSATPQEAVLAMRIGGRLGCASALMLHGAWVPPDVGTHVVFPSAASGRRSAGREREPSIVRHWSSPTDRTGSAFGIAPLELAIADVLKCLPPHLLIAVLDSLLHKRLISRNRLEALIVRGPQRVHHLIAHLERRSESGIESIIRYLLAMAGIATEVQVRMLSGDRTDIEVGDWLTIEADGRETHAKEKACEGEGAHRGSRPGRAPDAGRKGRPAVRLRDDHVRLRVRARGHPRRHGPTRSRRVSATAGSIQSSRKKAPRDSC